MKPGLAVPLPLMARLSEVLVARTGLHFPAERWRDLERGIVAAAPGFDMADATACAQWLLSAHLTRSQIEILASHLTVGETYFFREERSFEVLEQHILPELLQARAQGDRRLRIWSAGCCTGEEAYSIAMLVDGLIPHPRDWHVSILATDINPVFLRKAAEGIYGEWSFRRTPARIRARYFKPGKNARFEIDPALRKCVTFSYLNLADDVFPSLTNNTNAMDVIFCRNVLMYFSEAQAKKVVANLHRSLVDGGWLIVSPVETSISLFPGFTAVDFSGAILYRKLTKAHSPTPASDHLPEASPLPARFWPVENPVTSVARPTTISDASWPVEQPELRSSEAPETEVQAGVAPSSMARVCANLGNLVEAAQWCEQAIAADKLDPSNHYLLATILRELGQSDAATQALMRALYLNPDFVLAHFTLGSLCLSQSRHREAQRHFDNALSLLRAQPHAELVPESDGLTAGRLTEIIASARSSLPRAAIGHKEIWI